MINQAHIAAVLWSEWGELSSIPDGASRTFLCTKLQEVRDHWAETLT